MKIWDVAWLWLTNPTGLKMVLDYEAETAQLNALLPPDDRTWVQCAIVDIAAATIVPQSKVQSMVEERIFDYVTLSEVVAEVRKICVGVAA